MESSIILCLDISESMGYSEPAKIDQARNAIHRLIESIDDHHNFILVTFDSEAYVKLIGSDKDLLMRELDQLKVRGISCLSAGLKASLDIANSNSTILMISDGRANLSIDRMGGFEGSIWLEDELISIALKSMYKGRFYSIAVGEDSFTHSLKRLSDILNGWFYLVEDFYGLSTPSIRYRDIDVVEDLIVYPAPLELPAAQPSWSKESQYIHVAVVSRDIYTMYTKYRRVFISNPSNGREARIALIPIDIDVLEPYRRRQPRLASNVESGRAILLDSSYRSFLGVGKMDRVTLRIVEPIEC